MRPSFERDVQMMQDQDRWPLWPILPLKKYSGGLECALLTGHINDPVKPIVYHHNMFSIPKNPADRKFTQYASFEEIAEEWMVD